MTCTEPLRAVDWGGIGQPRPSVLDTDALINDICYTAYHNHPTKRIGGQTSQLGKSSSLSITFI
jgi:hypothetical protein